MSTPIHIRGRYLWQNDKRFFVRGVAYQLSGHDIRDPIADDRIDELRRDVALFKELGMNTIYVFSMDATKEHSKAMKMLEEAGIYVFTSASSPICAINRMQPYESYNKTTLQSFFKTVDIMAQYPNTLGILAGSEIVNNDRNISATPVIKAVVRDLKKYMRLRYEASGQRILPVGYNGATTGVRDQTILRYLSSGEDAIDFWTCKTHSWVGESDMDQSGYNNMIKQLQPTNIPIFISEYGSTAVQPRIFQETHAIYSKYMSQVFSGGCVYQFYRLSNGYGLVELIGEPWHPESVAHQKALQRAADPTKWSRKEEREGGVLLVTHEFENYKVALKDTTGIEEEWDRGALAGAQIRGQETVAEKWPWEPEFTVPDCCVNWEEI